MFFKLPGEKGDKYRFSSELECIGLKWDAEIQNGTYVEVISDPLEINTFKYGIMSVIKIKANVSEDYHTIIKEFWVPAKCIIALEPKFLN